MSNKPHIYYSNIDGKYHCESPGPSVEDGVRDWQQWLAATGKGGTAKEAFLDWYIKQVGEYLAANQVENDLPISAEDLWGLYS